MSSPAHLTGRRMKALLTSPAALCAGDVVDVLMARALACLCTNTVRVG
jgi:hypothetical protein